MKLEAVVLGASLILSLSVQAQDYHAIEGSPHAGAIGAANNPASIVNSIANSSAFNDIAGRGGSTGDRGFRCCAP